MQAVDAVSEQRFDALARANAVRLAQHALKREVAAGAVGLLAALDDPRAARLHVPALLMAPRGVGDTKVRRVLLLSRVSSSRRVGELTEREREALVAALDVVGIAAAEHGYGRDA